MAGKTTIHALLCLLGVEQPHSQTTAAERDTLRKYSSGRRHAAEIGVYEGRTTRVIAEAMNPNGRLYAIDPFLPGRLGVCWSKLVAQNHLRKSECKVRVEFLEVLSTEAVRQVTDDLDFVFIDGDHSLEGVERDWHDWSEKIGLMGIIALHDTVVPPYNPGVAQLGSHQFFESTIRRDPRFRILEQVDSLTVLKKNSL